ncbi:MAG: GntR family transcriptional regulator [Bacteroidales bacterium]|nr:GntR family transcriptional regulator [Bacteroidales bacterium]MBR6131723.1 GntR family transcriptional regulator [Bacteroidales bacterium]MCR5549749.1 GntR family transcriptional regulator [Bacteroidales bacterium]
MDFNNTQTIYMQIVDWVFEQILTAAWKPGDKAKSVRELAVMFEVNPNTVMRSYDYLQNNGIFLNKRGIGFFVTDDAVEKIKFLRKREFMEEEVPVFIKNVKLLDIDVNEIINLLKA